MAVMLCFVRQHRALAALIKGSEVQWTRHNYLLLAMFGLRFDVATDYVFAR